MRKIFRNWMGLFVVVFAVLVIVGLGTTSAQQYFTYIGRVVSISGGFLSVQGSGGDVMHFAVGRKTIYVSGQMPTVGARVKVTYFMGKGSNVGYQVEILPPPPPPPAPATTVTTPQEQETKEKKSIWGCTRCSTPRGAGERK